MIRTSSSSAWGPHGMSPRLTERGYDLLADDLDRMRGELEAARAEEQRLYDAGDRVNTFSRLDPTR